jgi:hypothetical protein
MSHPLLFHLAENPAEASRLGLLRGRTLPPRSSCRLTPGRQSLRSFHLVAGPKGNLLDRPPRVTPAATSVRKASRPERNPGKIPRSSPPSSAADSAASLSPTASVSRSATRHSRGTRQPHLLRDVLQQPLHAQPLVVRDSRLHRRVSTPVPGRSSAWSMKAPHPLPGFPGYDASSGLTPHLRLRSQVRHRGDRRD